MKLRLLATLILLFITICGLDQPESRGEGNTSHAPAAAVSYDDFKDLVAKVEAHRAGRLVDLDTFLKMSREPGVIILDTRSDFRYERLHVKGAKHLAFTDFTQGNLAKVIPSPETKILIYCNNNFNGDQVNFPTKASLPPPSPSSLEVTAQVKPITLALNIPTYINLYGYGYENVYELNELVGLKDKRIVFEGSVVEPAAGPQAQR